MKKTILGLFLALSLVLSCLPACAEGDETIELCESVCEITRGGTYRVTGEGSGISVKADDGAVTLILSGASVDGSITSRGASLLSIELEGENAVSADDEAISAKGDLEFTGTGILSVTGSVRASGDIAVKGGDIRVASEDHGIKTKKDFELSGGTLSVSAGKKGVVAEGTISVTGGSATIDADNDALHAAKDITLSGGSVTLSALDDAVHADGAVYLSGTTVTILTSHEGLEGTSVTVAGGTVSVASEEDGINASDLIDISGGEIHLSAGGDGIDSNKDIILSGGCLVIDGPTSGEDSPIDISRKKGGSFVISGGTTLALGRADEHYVPTDATIPYFLLEDTGILPGDVIRVTDKNGIVLVEHTAEKGGDTLFFACESLTAGGNVTVAIGDSEYDVPLR